MHLRARWLPPFLTACLLSLCLAAVSGCSKGKGPDKGGQGKDKPTAAASPVLEALQAVVDKCGVIKAGLFDKKCDKKAGKALQERLLKLEGENLQATMLGYCQAQKGTVPELRVAAAYRLDALHARARRGGNRALADCLVLALKRSVVAAEQRLLGRTAGYIAPLVGRINPLMIAIQGKPEATRAVYDVLWANGRIRVLHLLATAMKTTSDPVVRKVLVRGLVRGKPWNPREAEAVCDLVGRWADDKHRAVWTASLSLLARRCPKQGEAVLAKVNKRLPAKGFVHPGLLAAAEAVATRDNKAHGAAVAKLMADLAGNDKLGGGGRARALEALARLDGKRGAALAKRVGKGKGVPRQLKQAAEKVLGKGKNDE